MAGGKKIQKSKDKKSEQQGRMPKNYSLIKDIRKQPLYKSNIKRRDIAVRKEFEHLETESQVQLYTGQLVSFNYFMPHGIDELMYYDAKPVVIFLGNYKNKEGKKRFYGFNIHYYPPKIRYSLMDRIVVLFKRWYKNWDKPISRNIPRFDYGLFLKQLKKHNLDFGVRAYDPKLMTNIKPIPANMWNQAVFSEGKFKKMTREAIMKFWREWNPKK